MMRGHKKLKKMITCCIIIIFLISGCIFSNENRDIKYSPGAVELEKVTTTGAIINVTKTWSDKSMSLKDHSFQGQLIWHNGTLYLMAVYFFTKIGNTTGGSIQFIDINEDSKLSVGDKFYLGSETKNGAPLWPNTTYEFAFDDDSNYIWNTTFKTLAI